MGRKKTCFFVVNRREKLFKSKMLKHSKMCSKKLQNLQEEEELFLFHVKKFII